MFLKDIRSHAPDYDCEIHFVSICGPDAVPDDGPWGTLTIVSNVAREAEWKGQDHLKRFKNFGPWKAGENKIKPPADDREEGMSSCYF